MGPAYDLGYSDRRRYCGIKTDIHMPVDWMKAEIKRLRRSTAPNAKQQIAYWEKKIKGTSKH